MLCSCIVDGYLNFVEKTQREKERDQRIRDRYYEDSSEDEYGERKEKQKPTDGYEKFVRIAAQLNIDARGRLFQVAFGSSKKPNPGPKFIRQVMADLDVYPVKKVKKEEK